MADRAITVASPLGEGRLLFRKMTAHEELGRPFQFDLDLLSEDEKIPFDALMGHPMTVRLALPGGKTRCFCGHVSRFRQVGRELRYASYQATLRPWLWFLSQTSDCRIFQGKTVPEIVKAVFREDGLSDFDEVLSGSYPEREYCVQYRETDFNFVSRLLEEEGIYYYFRHEEGKHTLVLADDYSSHDRIPGYEEIPYYPPSENVVREEHIFAWRICRDVQPGTYALNDFDFEKPKASLAAKSAISRSHPGGDFEMYDYPGKYRETKEGERYARAHIEALQAAYERLEGEGNARGVAAGGLFELTGYPRSDQDREYLIVSADHELRSGAYESGGETAAPEYTSRFVAIDSRQPFRCLPSARKPVVQGPQTAVVVGKSGEEIWTDKYGRVNVQFPWDREGKSDENSSCWMRVAQVWAGKKWGAVHVPRLGEEVIVDFLEGDPDRPIITGRVYNADCMPPWELPANRTQTGIRSRSSKQGSGENYNEIRFEDKKGEEELFLHAEKDMNVVVRKDATEEIGGDQSVKVKKKIHVEAGDEITLLCGQSKLVMTKAGKITLSGFTVTVDGKTKVEHKSDGQLNIKGLKTQVQSTTLLDLKASGIASLKGSVTKLG